MVSKRWVDCRHRGLILGKTATGFSLTPTGLKLAEKVSEQLTGQRLHFNRPGSNKVSGETRTRAGRFVKSLEHSDAFKLYSAEQEQARISEFDFRSMLLCTMESSAVTLSKNLGQFKQYVGVYERTDLINFLDFCARKFAHLLTESSGETEKHRGGMKRQKIKCGKTMSIEITRKLECADRVAVQQADQAIRKDVVRALVELITNSNDSYHRMEDAGIPNEGRIIIELQRKHADSILRVCDNAEGMTPDDMDAKVGKYGEATSGFKEGKSVRGLWGSGLKDSFFGLGHGSVSSIRDGAFSRCSLSVASGKPTYQREKSLRATRAIKNQYELPLGNGTVMEIVVSREDVRVPQFENLRRNLERHFELRAIMSSPKRTVLLREVDARGKVSSEVTLNHKAPIGVEVLNDTVSIAGHTVEARVQVFRANEPLSTPAEEGDYADGGFLIISKGVVLALTLFKFEHNEHAARFYGNVSCDHLHELLKKDDRILTATRDGISWKHEFTKALMHAIEAKLEPLVEEERKRAQAEQRSTMNRKLRERLNNALHQLNSIADSELGKISGEGDGTGIKGKKPPYVPPSGFGFVPEYAYIQTGKAYRRNEGGQPARKGRPSRDQLLASRVASN